MEPKISVIIPVYHPRKEYIDRLLDSIVRQTIGVDQLEIILVVDGDDRIETRQMLEAWEAQYSDHILLIFYEENRKPGYARTLGMSHASGEYIAFADQDDWLSLDMYQVLYETACHHGCEVISSQFTRDTEYQRPEPAAEKDRKEALVLDICTVSDRKEFLMSDWYGGYWTALYSRTYLQENNIYFPEGMTFDDNFFGTLVFYSVKKFVFLDIPFYHWFINWDSISMKQNEGFYLDRLRIEMKKIEELDRRGLFSVYHDEIECKFYATFFLNTFHMIFCRLDGIPYQAYLYMADTLKKLFPGYRKNKYIMEKYSWSITSAYDAVYNQYQQVGDNAEIAAVLEEFPIPLRGLAWIDIIDRILSEEEMVWWKRLYMLRFVN